MSLNELKFHKPREKFSQSVCRVISKLLNYNSNVGQTTPVGSYPEGATPEGLYDMAGNVWEWTDSWYNKQNRSYRVFRGGSWSNIAVTCRSAIRLGNPPVRRVHGVGFRPVFVP